MNQGEGCTSSSTDVDVRPRQVAIRKRPKDRKAQIASAAAIAFSERGYHAVSVEEIASSVGISGSALYRHFPNKYALFLHSALALTEELEGALDSVEFNPDATERDRLQADLLAVIRTTIRNRRTAGIYRWEGRFLGPEDRAVIGEQSRAVNRQVARNLSPVEPPLDMRDKVIVVAAMLSAIGSITAHSRVLPQRRMERLLLDACLSLDRVTLASPTELPVRLSSPQLVTTNKRELLLHEAMRLFNSRGYHDVSIEEIAAAAGFNASGMYRFFPSKADLLAALFYRAADRLDLATAAVLEAEPSAAAALRALSSMYVNLSFVQHELMSVYFSEMSNLLPSHRSDLRNRQKLHVAEWASLLLDVRPELSAVEAEFVVHAALNVVPDVGRLIGFDPEPGGMAKVQQLMAAVLFGNH
ncbi:helix-turn-helix domain-containing protein [Rhodococcus sp. IEGM 1409]|uniref:TetR/AcrR family transcriptional regulator n=1 Tax=Rhodococcus sp. IEGM 1409 TaxID=3047082 RepID=UPI0024B7283D|nr:TetR/AcrR family transcriptional regulator [Rhodococcus sp. IEGM 1409]MDI9903310.1 helix-turn-helix domain-containing protein [Rhodococcus sp. IEGM 1409]